MPYPAYLDLSAKLTSRIQEAVAAFVRHAKRPNVGGADTAHRKLWAAAYEARASLAEQNPAFAATLLPAAPPTTAINSLPLVPAAVRWAVDEAGAGTLSVSVDIAGPLSLTVAPPGPDAPFAATLDPGATRQQATFTARTDGLYALYFSTAGTPLTTVYVPVNRGAFALFREDSRSLGFGFRLNLPAPHPDYELRLALLASGEAAAATSQPELANRLFAAAKAVTPAATPTAVFPYPRRDD